jgi:ABC-type glycerol-3-phosphate transport system permease component
VRRGAITPYLIVGPISIVLAFPFYWMLWTALKTDADLYNVDNNPYGFGSGSPTGRNFRFLFEETEYGQWLQNTLVVGIAVVVITLVLALPAGYALARLSGTWGQTMGIGIFLTYLVPPTLLFLPMSRVVSELGLQNRLLSLVVVYPSFTVPFSTWLLMGFFKTIPRELEDAALIDGASRIIALVRVVFPISLPGILTVVIFSFSLRRDVHQHLGQPDRVGRRADRADPRRRLLLGRADGCCAHPEHPAGAPLQHVPRPLHRRLHRGCVPMTHLVRKSRKIRADPHEGGRE